MSDQPEPTTSQRTQCPSCGQLIPMQQELVQPKPTGEWTPEHVKALGGYIDWTLTGCSKVAEAHNAALDEAVDAAEQEILVLRQQLAAERKKVAAAQATIKKAHFRFRPPPGDTAALDAAIAAATKPLVDALKKIRQLTDINMICDLADEALAKMKDAE